MPRHYKKKVGGRAYGNYSPEQLAKALAAIRGGISQARASRKFKICRGTLQNKMFGKHTKAVGHPVVFTQQEEQLVTHTLTTVSNWGFPLTKVDIREVLHKYLEKQGRMVNVFRNNIPGPDFVQHFIERNNLSVRLASNIKRARAAVGAEAINEFFTNVEEVLKDANPALVFNYDETNIQDDPGSKKVIVSRGTRHSKAAVSVMVCGSANGILLPPMVVYKAGYLYENWTYGGPNGTIYAHSPSGWFDMTLFEKCFFDILLPYLSSLDDPGQKIVIGDNLASHFSPAVIKACEENNIYLTPLPPNSTHLMQPLDVSVFAPMKKKWREILDTWRKESRSSGSIPKQQFPTLLARLWTGISLTVAQNLISGFRATGLCPFKPTEVLNKIPNAGQTANPEMLSESLIDLLQEMRGADKQKVIRKRGKRIEPGKALATTPDEENILPEHPNNDIEEPQPKQQNKGKKTAESEIKKPRIKVSSEPQPGPSGIKRPNRSAKNTKSQDRCSICFANWANYAGPDWIACAQCERWVCGICNEASTDPYYSCSNCEERDFDSDDSVKDRHYNPIE